MYGWLFVKWILHNSRWSLGRLPSFGSIPVKLKSSQIPPTSPCPDIGGVSFLFRKRPVKWIRQFVRVLVQFEIAQHINGCSDKGGWVGDVFPRQCRPRVSSSLWVEFSLFYFIFIRFLTVSNTAYSSPIFLKSRNVQNLAHKSLTSRTPIQAHQLIRRRYSKSEL